MQNVSHFDCDVIHEEIVNQVKEKMPERKSFDELADFYKIFSNNTRVQILWALGCNEMCVCDLAVLLNMSKSAISHQLKTLRLSKAVKFRRDGKVVYYSLADEHVKNILEQGFVHINE